jgi:hypothetical protein
MLRNKLITVNRILNEEWFTEWELEGIMLDSVESWHLVFEFIGYLKGTNQWVYACHDADITQRLLSSRKRCALLKKFSIGDDKNNNQ